MKRIWNDRVRYDIKEKGLSVDEVYIRATRRLVSSYIDPTYVGIPGRKRKLLINKVVYSNLT